MKMRSRALAIGRLLLVASVWSPLASAPAGTQTPPSQAPGATAAASPLRARVRWLSDLGAESFVASPGAVVDARPGIVVAVPGSAYVLDLQTDGTLHKRQRLAADPAAPYGVAVADAGVALADRQGWLSAWTAGADGAPSLRWRRELGDRVTSVGWSGGPLVLAATWRGRLSAFAFADGRPAWSVELGGRAEAPAVADGESVYVATKTKVLFRLDAATGAIRWKVVLPGTEIHPPVVFGEAPRLVVCGTWEGDLVAYDSATGRSRWSAALGAKLAGAPLAGPGVVAVVTADGAVQAYDPAGRLSWTAPDAADGPASLVWQETAAGTPRLLSVSRTLVRLDASSGQRGDEYPKGALDGLRRRFADAMLEGEKTYSEAEKHAIQEREAFEIAGSPFAPARLSRSELAFSTEDGWAYVFDAARLRPIARFRAGEAASGVSALALDRALASAGEDLYALDTRTGRTLWKRTVGSRPTVVARGNTLGVLSAGRVHAIAAADGALDWSLRGSIRALASPSAEAVPWLVDDGLGQLRAVQPPGRFVADPLPIGGELLALRPVSAHAWLAATREGTLFGVEWLEPAATEAARGPARLVRTTEKTWGEPLAELQVAPGRVLVRSAGGTLACLDPVSLEERWRTTLAKDDRLQLLENEDALLVLAAAELRLYDLASGTLRSRQPASGVTLAARLEGALLERLDRAGSVTRTSLADGQAETARLELPLAEAVPAPGGFLVSTAAGELGFVEVTADAAPAVVREGVTP